MIACVTGVIDVGYLRKPVFKIRFFSADLSSQAELFTGKKLPEFE